MCLNRPRDLLPTRVDLCPPLPSAYHAALGPALAALAVRLAPAAARAIDGHVRLVMAWNEAINLTAVRDPAAIAIRHVADSLTALRVLRERGIDQFIDLGSGGGFPGLPLAAALPSERALLVDSVGKKVRFLTTAVSAVGLEDRAEAATVRSETLAAEPAHRGRWPAVTARAVAALAELVELALPLLAPGGILVAWKRGMPGDATGLGGELDAARRALDAIDPGGRIVLEDAIPAHAALADIAGHRLVIVERSRRHVAASWPREPAARRQRPW